MHVYDVKVATIKLSIWLWGTKSLLTQLFMYFYLNKVFLKHLHTFLVLFFFSVCIFHLLQCCASNTHPVDGTKTIIWLWLCFFSSCNKWSVIKIILNIEIQNLAKMLTDQKFEINGNSWKKFGFPNSRYYINLFEFH